MNQEPAKAYRRRFLPYFDAIGGDPDGLLGRVVLATKLYYLFAVDPQWVGKHLIPRLIPESSDEACELWSAYGWSPTVGPDLLQAFKDSFLEVLRNGEDGGPRKRKRNLTRLFVTVCLDAPGELTAEEIHGVVEAMSERALSTVLASLKRRLKGNPAEQARIWQDTLQPWLGDYWPRAEVRNTAGTSVAMLDLLAECGDAFADAAEWALHYLRPLDRHGLYRLGENGHAEQNPDSMLSVLDRVAVADTLPVHERSTLHKILDGLKAAKPDLAADTRFQRLYQLATQ